MSSQERAFVDSIYMQRQVKAKNAFHVQSTLDIEEDLEKHLLKCAALRQRSEQEREPTFSKDFNRDIHSTVSLPEGETRSERRAELASSLGSERLLDLIQRVSNQLEKFDDLELDFRIPEVATPFLESDGKRPFNVKHALQQSSIVGYMIRSDIFEELDPLIIEFGAGKAYLASMIADCTTARSFVLLDNQAFKFKAERSMKNRMDLTVRRLRVDLKDFDVSKLTELECSEDGCLPWVACGKHLCGGSTDFTLNTCIRALQSQAFTSDQETCSKGGLRGIFLTTCCHHRCDWESYVAKDQFLSFGFTPEEFELVSWMTGWALCEQGNRGSRDHEKTVFDLEDEGFHDDDVYYWRSYPKEFRISIGRKCKRLIDEGRRLWLNANHTFSKLELYVPHDVSPENKILVVRPKY